MIKNLLLIVLFNTCTAFAVGVNSSQVITIPELNDKITESSNVNKSCPTSTCQQISPNVVKPVKRNIKVNNSTKGAIINSLTFDFAYSGDILSLPMALKQYDSRLNILKPLGKIAPTSINIDLQAVKLSDIIEAVNTQTSQQAQLVYDSGNNSLRVIFSSITVDVGKTAVDESLKWQKGNAPLPVISRDGVIRFPYGEYQPVVICQPLQLCDIELQAGETVNSIVLGDTPNWNEGDNGVPIVYSGSKASLKPHLVLKPSQGGLDTTLMVTTDKRTYMIRLKSANNGYVSRVGFYYPADLVQTLENNKQNLRDQVNAQSNGASSLGVSSNPLMIDISKMNNNYDISGGNYDWKPTGVLDNGSHVYIQMPVNIDPRNLPALCVIVDGDDTETQCEYVNWKYDNHVYVVDKLFNEAKLINGFGDYQQVITIKRRNSKKGFWARLFGG